MDRAAVAVRQAPAPLTERSTFTITARDVGSPAVRPGCMAELEQQRHVLVLACKLALDRMESKFPPEHPQVLLALKSAVLMATHQ